MTLSTFIDKKRKGIRFLPMALIIIISMNVMIINKPSNFVDNSISFNAIGSFTGGDGTSINPYQISNITQLQDMISEVTAHYVLIHDIDASETIHWNNGMGFISIGNTTTPWDYFSGSLNGRGHKISDLFISRSSEDEIGLFGRNIGNITNLSLVNCTISGDYKVGGLVGHNSGVVSNLSIINCNVKGNKYVGGIVGDNEKPGSISDSYSSGFVEGGSAIGGFVGLNWADIDNCQSSVDVESNGKRAGGLIGRNEGIVSNCYSTGNITGTNSSIGGLIGSRRYGITINSFYCINDTSLNQQKYITPYGIYKHQFDRWLNGNKSLDINNYLMKNTSNGFYEISTVADLKNLLPFSTTGNFRFSQISDIDLKNDPGFYLPIFYDGLYSGNYYKIYNLNITYYNNSKLGMFGFLGPGMKIENLIIVNSIVSGSSSVGGLVGSNQGVVSNCSNIGILNGYAGVGGLVGDNSDGAISNSYSSGTVEGKHDCGGLVGYQYEGAISNSYSTCDVSGYEDVGGFLGYQRYGSVKLSYSTGYVSGMNNIGGLIGMSIDSTVMTSFWDTQTSGTTSSTGGIGRGTNYMKTKSTYVGSGWDFSKNWYIFEDFSYPYLRTFLSDDNEVPSFGADLSPLFGETGNSYRFIIRVVDNTGLDEVKVKYWHSMETSSNISLKGSNIYNVTIDIPPDLIGNIKYTFFAKDFHGNWNTTQIKNITIFDDDKPLFGSDLTPTSCHTGEEFEIGIEVTDNILIQEVWIEYWFGNNFHINQTMNTTNYFSRTIIIPEKSLESLHYIFHASDISGNWASSNQSTIVIIDDDLPILINDRSDNICFTGDDYHFKIEVDDNIEINEVWVEYWFTDDSHFNFTLDNIGNYIGKIQIPINSTLPLNYIIHFNDTADNWNVSEHNSIPTIDNDSPELILDETPLETTTGSNLTFSLTIKDNIMIKSVILEYWFGYKISQEIEMSLRNGKFESILHIPLNSTETLYYIIKTFDINDNKFITNPNEIIVIDNIIPTIKYIGEIEAYMDILFEIVIDANDNIGIDSYYFDGILIHVINHSFLYKPKYQGNSKINLTVFDVSGNIASQIVSLQVLPNDYDRDGDGIPDLIELSNGLNMNISSDAFLDIDNDGLTNLEEYQNGTDMRIADSDGDGMPDGWEVFYSLNPLFFSSENDTDNDGKTDLEEYIKGTNPIIDENNDYVKLPWFIYFSILTFSILTLLLITIISIYTYRKRSIKYNEKNDVNEKSYVLKEFLDSIPKSDGFEE